MIVFPWKPVSENLRHCNDVFSKKHAKLCRVGVNDSKCYTAAVIYAYGGANKYFVYHVITNDVNYMQISESFSSIEEAKIEADKLMKKFGYRFTKNDYAVLI